MDKATETLEHMNHAAHAGERHQHGRIDAPLPPPIAERRTEAVSER